MPARAATPFDAPRVTALLERAAHAPEAVLADSVRLAAEIANGPTFAHAVTKRMLHAEWAMPIDVAIAAEAEAQARCMQTEDFRRAYRAFVAKSKPQFEGN